MPYQLIEELIELNKAQSTAFTAEHDDRIAYRQKHPTEIGALKCMDGRLHLPVMTRTPLGIIQPWRNIGGQFDLGWPFLGEKLKSWVTYAESRERKNLILATYHFSRGDTHRGCAGFKYDTDAARESTFLLKAQLERVFSRSREQVYPICVGVETDLDGLILHGALNETLDTESLNPKTSSEELREMLRRLYPDMHKVVLNDLLTLVLGNLKHVDVIRKAKRPVVAMQHMERVLAVGQGFDWLHRPNFALIVGPFSPDIASPIAVAASIIKSNIAEERIPPSGFVLLTSCPYRDAGEEKLFAIERTRFYAKLAMDVIRDRMPELAGLVHPLTTVLDFNTRKFEIVK